MAVTAELKYRSEGGLSENRRGIPRRRTRTETRFLCRSHPEDHESNAFGQNRQVGATSRYSDSRGPPRSRTTPKRRSVFARNQRISLSKVRGAPVLSAAWPTNTTS